MKRRIIGIIAAAALAVLGTVALVTYVRSAEDRALAGQELAPVYIVTQAIPAGTPTDSLAPSLRLDEVPVKALVTGATTDLAALGGLVTAVELLPGEQLTATRMIDPANQTVRSDGLRVPPGLQEVTIELAQMRAAGGMLRAGDTVGVIVTFDTPEPSAVAGTPVVSPDGQVTDIVAGVPNGGGTSHMILHKVLVTGVQSSTGVVEGADAPPPTGDLLVTLAVSAADAERVVFAAEFGRLWLTAEGPDADESGTSIQTRASVHQPTARSAQ